MSTACSNISPKSFLIHTASQLAMLATMYSASAVLRATDFYSLLIQDIVADPKLKQHPNDTSPPSDIHTNDDTFHANVQLLDDNNDDTSTIVFPCMPKRVVYTLTNSQFLCKFFSE